jgi:ComF family protein
MSFLDFLFPPRVDEAVLRTITLDSFLSLCTPRLVNETRPGTVALLPFSNKAVRSAIHEAKYHGSAHAFELLGSTLAEYLRDADDLSVTRSNLVARFDLVTLVPVPLGKLRHKERGYNQVEEIANRAAKLLGCTTDSTLLTRVRETASQVSLPREEREANMRGAFGAAHSADPALTYILIDDVITTGATLQAATLALTEAGASHIIPLALAH